MNRYRRFARAIGAAMLVASSGCGSNMTRWSSVGPGGLDPARLPLGTDTMSTWRNPKRPALHNGIPWDSTLSRPAGDGWISDGERVVTVRHQDTKAGYVVELIDDGRRAVGQERSMVDAQFSATTLRPIRMHSEEPDHGSATDFVLMDSRIAELPSGEGLKDTLFNNYPDGAFTSTELDLVLRSLPLEEGYRVSLPLYYPFSYSHETVPVEVDGQDFVRTREGTTHQCWRITVRLRGNTPDWFWVDTSTRELIRAVSQDDAGAVWVETR
jgi:hypothetical protein